MELIKYDYNDISITFSGYQNTMVNATEMAKAFGKRPYDWMILSSTKEFLKTLESVTGIPATELVQIKQGGSNQGTWYHEDVAIEFARWLSPVFGIWCNNRIKEILKNQISEQAEEIKRLQNQSPFPVCKKSISMQTFANFLTTYTGEKVGRTTLFEICRKYKYIQVESTRPYQKYINNGFFEVATKEDNIVPLVTPKGQKYISRRLLKATGAVKSYPLF